MYDMKVKTPPLAQKRRSWTGRLKDRFKTGRTSQSSDADNSEDDPLFVVSSGGYPQMPPAHHLHHSTTTASGADDWTSGWVSHPHLQEGHHAPSVPSLQGSVFVAANFVYDYRQKYGHHDGVGWLNGTPGKPSIGSVAARRSTTDWSAARGLFPVVQTSSSSSPVFRAQQPDVNRNRIAVTAAVAESGVGGGNSSVEFRAADVNQNIRQWRELKKHSNNNNNNNTTKVTISHAPVSVQQLHHHHQLQQQQNGGPPPLPLSPPPPLPADDDVPKTTVAVDRPGLVVTGERICILTGQDANTSAASVSSSLPYYHQHEHSTAAAVEKVSVKVEFQRHCPLRRSLSDRARPKMAAPASFHDTTRLTQKSRSRGSLHDLFGVPTVNNQCAAVAGKSPTTMEPVYATAAAAGQSKRRTIVRPSEPPPPPPPPPPCSPAPVRTLHQPGDAADPPVAPPRRIYRYSQQQQQQRVLTSPAGTEDPSDAQTPPAVDLSPGVTSWAGRPLSGQVVSWTAWSGHASLDESGQPGSDDKSAVAVAPNRATATATAASRPSDETKRRPVSRLWPSFSSIGRDRSVHQQQQQQQQRETATSSSPEEHIYEEIDDVTNGAKERNIGKPTTTALTRTGRGGSFAGASRADILRYLEELRKKHPTGMISADGERKSPMSTSSPPMTPSLPQLIAPADDEDDDDMGALLLAMRHNGPNRHSNRSTQSSASTSTQSSGQDSAASASALSGSTTYQNTLLGGGAGSGGGEIERNDSGVGSETSGTAQRLRRLRRLRCHAGGQQQHHHHHHQQVASADRKLDSDDDDDDEEDVDVLSQQQQQHQQPNDDADDAKATVDGALNSPNWCVDCDQAIETDPDDGLERLVCHRCARRRCERREVLAELLETEVRYGRDLRVLQDELYKPLLVAGLVPLRQLDAVFLNVAELASQSQRFGQRLREAVEIALEQGDEDLLTVDVARLFLDKETEDMMDAFRRYCVRSGEASLLLSSLEKERELLRIFLRASQLENPALRRMDLHAFLMVPVQRITKYPLLLGRLLRATAQQDVDMREALREAQAKVESYLTAINAEAKELGSASRPWRRGYSVPNLNLNLNVMAGSGGTMQRPSGEELMNLRLRKMAMDCLAWPDNGTVQLVLEGYVKLTQPGELLLTATKSRGRTLKWQNIWMALVVHNHHVQDKAADFELGAPDSLTPPPAPEASRLSFGLKQTVHEAAVVFIKDVKNLRPGPSLFRDPLMLSQCTVSCETDELPNFFEIHHMMTKESFICQTADAGQTQQWLVRLRSLSLSLGRWKQRRNALPHVMMIAN